MRFYWSRWVLIKCDLCHITLYINTWNYTCVLLWLAAFFWSVCYVSEIHLGWRYWCIHFLFCMAFHAANMPGFPLLPSREKMETGSFSAVLHTDKTVRIFTVHPNTKGEMLQDPRLFMKGSPIKISTLVFPRLYCFPTLSPAPWSL